MIGMYCPKIVHAHEGVFLVLFSIFLLLLSWLLFGVLLDSLIKFVFFCTCNILLHGAVSFRI